MYKLWGENHPKICATCMKGKGYIIITYSRKVKKFSQIFHSTWKEKTWKQWLQKEGQGAYTSHHLITTGSVFVRGGGESAVFKNCSSPLHCRDWVTSPTRSFSKHYNDRGMVGKQKLNDKKDGWWFIHDLV